MTTPFTPLISLPLAETVTILHMTQSGTDAYGDAVWTVGSEETIPAVVVPRVISHADSSAAMPRVAQAGTYAVDLPGASPGWELAEGFDIFIAEPVAVAQTDRLVVRGETYQIDSAPAVFRSPFTTAGGLQIGCSAITG